MKTYEFTSPLLVLGNAELNAVDRAFVNQWPGPVACCDGGARHWTRGVPDLHLGDGDSSAVAPGGTDINLNDLENLLNWVKAPKIVALGCLGGRWDHSFANLNLLPRFENLELRDGHQRLRGAIHSVELTATPGDYVGVLPLEPCHFTSSSGLAYDLAGVALAPMQRMGSSNIATAERVAITGHGRFIVSQAPSTL